MITKIYSKTLKTFKTIEFHEGFNFLVSESVDGLSNNGTGKSSLIQIINFCLCSSSEKIMEYKELNNHEFSIDLKFEQGILTLTRKIDGTSSKIIIDDENNILGLGTLKNSEKSIDNVKEKLAKLFFNVDDNVISFRTLISPFMKRGAYAFNHIFKTHAMEKNIVTQLKNSFLIGIPSEPVIRLKNIINDRETFLKLKEIKESDIIWKKENIRTLNSKLLKIKKEIGEYESDLKEFNIDNHDSESINNINNINLNLSDLLKQKFILKSQNDNNKKLIRNENILNINEIKEIITEADFLLSDSAITDIEKVQNFHHLLQTNRNNRIKEQIEENNRRISELDLQINDLLNKKKNLLKLFDKKGYLDEYYSINEIITRLKIEYSELEKQYNVYKELDKIEKDTKEKSKSVMKDMYENLNSSAFKKVNNRFSEYIKNVFGEKGKLIIEFKDNTQYSSKGYTFDWQIPRKASTGYLKGCIAAIDVVLIENNINKYPLFLVHDSVVFDSTDKGYVAKFLNMVYESTKKYKYQYICCLNDDQIIYSDICEELRNLYNNSQKLSQKDTLFGISFGDR